MRQCDIDDCNIYRAQYFLKHKWVPIILFVMDDKANSFTSLKKQIKYISNKRLSEALKLLIEHKLLIQEDDMYKLTDEGRKLRQIVMLMSEFQN